MLVEDLLHLGQAAYLSLQYSRLRTVCSTLFRNTSPFKTIHDKYVAASLEAYDRRMVRYDAARIDRMRSSSCGSFAQCPKRSLASRSCVGDRDHAGDIRC